MATRTTRGDAAVVYFGEPFKSTYYEITFDRPEHVEVKFKRSV